MILGLLVLGSGIAAALTAPSLLLSLQQTQRIDAFLSFPCICVVDVSQKAFLAAP
jgi:hypothetical protein